MSKTLSKSSTENKRSNQEFGWKEDEVNKSWKVKYGESDDIKRLDDNEKEKEKDWPNKAALD